MENVYLAILIRTRGHARFARIPLVVRLGDSRIRRTQVQANLMRIFQDPQWAVKIDILKI